MQLPPLDSVLTLSLLLSILTVGFLLVALVFVRANIGDILEDEIGDCLAAAYTERGDPALGAVRSGAKRRGPGRRGGITVQWKTNYR